jgi:glycosyltransferase involved in cell wall biosynthesis
VKNLLIFLLTHNRPILAIQAIKSILAQTDRRFKLVVSDNSDTDELRPLIGDLKGFTYAKRLQSLSGIDHGNLVLNEITAHDSFEYFSLFHDDDVMLSNYVSEFWKAQALFPEAATFGANAIIERHGIGSGLSFKAARPYIGPVSPNDLLRRYFSHHQLGIAPFPSYIYKTSALNGLQFDSNGGKYSDVQWLSRWCIKGPMIWIAEPMMVYRFHESNDGNLESRFDRLQFLTYLKSSRDLFSPEILSDYRNFFYKKLLTRLKEKGYEKSYRLLAQFIARHRLRRLFRLSFFNNFFKKALTKLYLKFDKKA